MDKTEFAPATRATEEDVASDYQLLSNNDIVVEVLRSFPNIVLVLNEHRQVVFYNDALLSALGIEEGFDLLGMRPGEIFECIHADDAPSGCGTSSFCKYCGAVLAILSALEGGSCTRECRISYKEGDREAAMDLSVTATSTVLCNKAYVVFSINDISDKKKRAILERIFFHDVLNTAGSLHSAIDLVLNAPDKSLQAELLSLMPKISSRLLDEIKSQQNLLLAESGELKTIITEIDSVSILQDLIDEYQYINSFDEKVIVLDKDTYSTTFRSDPILIKRILANMLKNSCEASSGGDLIEVGCHKAKSGFRFFVKNPQVMSDEVKAQVFKRSYSTKGTNRGIGTYSMKLLGENYLGARVHFESLPSIGTVFYLEFEGEAKN